MALGDCYSPPCASPLDFEQVLVNLFALNANNCPALKIHLDIISTDVTPCDHLTLQELILHSLVEDGGSGYALRMINVGMVTPDCYPCEFTDFETLLKSLFMKQGDCYGVKFAAGAVSCTGITSMATCAAPLTAEQLFRNCIGHDSTNGNYLLINELVGTCGLIDCELELNWDIIMSYLVGAVTGECYSVLNLQAITTPIELTDYVSCTNYFSFEQCVKDCLTEVDCGWALNVILTNGVFPRGEEV